MTGLATSSGPTLLGELRALESRIDESEKLFSRGPIGELADLLPQIIAQMEGDAKDAARWRFVVRNSSWIRQDDPHDNYSLMCVRLPLNADLSSVGSRTDAIDRAIDAVKGKA